MTIDPTTLYEPSGTRLVGKGDGPPVHTARQEVDARTALCQGLADYLLGLSIPGLSGRDLKLKHVFKTYPEPEDEAIYPSALVSSPDRLMYDASRFTPGIDPSQRVAAPDNRYLVTLAEAVLPITVQVWTVRPRDRSVVAMALESAFNPRDDVYGLILELPFYFNSRAAYAMTSSQYDDTEENAMRRYRPVTFVLDGQVPVVRLSSIKDARLRTEVVVDGSA